MWAKNLELIRREYPALAEKVTAPFDGDGSAARAPVKLELCAAERGGLTLKAAGVFVHSSRDPVREAEKLTAARFEGLSGGEGAAVIMGFGLGYYALAAQKLFPSAVLLIVESRLEVFKTALNVIDLRPLFSGGRHIFVVGGDGGGLIAAMQFAGKIRAVMRNSSLTNIDRAWYGEIERKIKLWESKDTVNSATLKRFGGRWVKNLAANLRFFRDSPGVSALAAKFDFPILLVAAGPSLDGLLPSIKEFYERFIIIAVDTSLRFLQNAGIKADFTVTADPQYWNLRHLDNMENAAGRVIADPAVQNAALRPFMAGNGVFLSSASYPLGKFIEEAVGFKGKLGAGGSVATSALDFALMIQERGQAPVYIAGLDFAFPNLKTHYKGALFEQRMPSMQSRFLPSETLSFNAIHAAGTFFVKDSAGGMVLTDKRLSLYAQWFENRVKNRDAALVFSLSVEGAAGAAIGGLKTITVEKALELPPVRAGIERRKDEVFSAIALEWKAGSQGRSLRFKAAKEALLYELNKISVAADAAALAGIESSAEFENANNVINSSPAKDVAGFLFDKSGLSPQLLLKSYVRAADFNIKAIEGR